MQNFVETSWGKVAYQTAGDSSSRRVLAFHGWLDNSNTFVPLQQTLAAAWNAVDLPGHGYSEHLLDYPFSQWVPVAESIANALEFTDGIDLVGHSMGGSICLLFAAAFPDRVNSVVCLDALGPMTSEPTDYAESYRQACVERTRIPKNRVSKSRSALVRARVAGLPYLDSAHAELLADGAIEEKEGGWSFTHDPRLKSRSLLRFTEAHVLELFRAVKAPVLLVRPHDGFPIDETLMQTRMDCLENGELAFVDGHHHAHMSHSEQVADAMREFWGRLDT